MDTLARLQANKVGGLGCEWMSPRDSELADKDVKEEKKKKKKRKEKKRKERVL